MKWYWILIFNCLCTQAMGQWFDKDILQQTVNQRKYQVLDTAFRYQLPSQKTHFFEEWQRESVLYEDKCLKSNDSVCRAIQFFFTDIFIPDTDTTRGYFKVSEFDSINKKYFTSQIHWNACPVKAEYFVLQPVLNYAICPDSIIRTKHTRFDKSDYSFRPQFKEIECVFPDARFMDKKKLYLTKNYFAILNAYALKEYLDNKRNKQADYLRLRTNKRRLYLQPELETSKSHDGWYYHFETFPAITEIFFNERFDLAVIEFRSSFNTFGYAKYRRKNNRWLRISYEREFGVQ